jgi:2-keto-4-pentenoate hydratase/2-oxohepta-3-ene-1,7-dioic acid hydratase in catechol pathway
MKLARFEMRGATRIGKVIGDRVIDLSSVPAAAGGSMRALLEVLPDVRGALEAVTEPSFKLGEVKLVAPIDDPQKFLAIGMNYRAHADEAAAAGIKIPTSQLWFNKQVSCIAGPYDPVVRPHVSDQLDYEGELAYVIGKKCRNVSFEQVRSVIAGYMVCNDVTVRDWQHRTPTYTLGKSFDTHGPIGPWITTPDEIRDAEDLTLTLSVNGVEKQRSSTSDLIYKIADQITYLSTVMTLYPGDIVTTGTPSGVAAVTQNWLRPGDIVRVEIEGLGHIENQVVAEQA